MPMTRSRTRLSMANAAAKPPAVPVPSAAHVEKRVSQAAVVGSSSQGNNAEASTRSIKKPQQRKAHDPRMRRRRSGTLDLEKDIAIQMSRKKVKVKKEEAERKVKVSVIDWNFIYVGNIDPSINEAQLRTVFKECGIVTRIQFRCSRGQAITIGMPINPSVQTARDRQYATVEFTHPSAVRKALKMDGTCVNGSKLVVSVSPADLPEVQDILRNRQVELARRGKQGAPARNVKHPSTVRPVTQHPTEVMEVDHANPPPPPKDRHVIFGISFIKTIL